MEMIWVNIYYSKEEFKSKFGFWEIKNFKIYDQDGNSSYATFEDDTYAYFSSYGTS
jgi:hypothetical protein